MVAQMSEMNMYSVTQCTTDGLRCDTALPLLTNNRESHRVPCDSPLYGAKAWYTRYVRQFGNTGSGADCMW